MKDLKEEQVSTEYQYRGKIVKMRTDRAKMPDGAIVDREVVEHPGGVGIAMEDAEGKFYMVTQWRYAQKGVFVEFPAGKKEKGEDPLTTARREIVEETGYEGTEFEYLGKLVPTPAYDEEVIDLYYTRQGKHVGQHLDSDEFINLSRMSLQEIIDQIMAGGITDAKTIAMAFLIQERKKRMSRQI
jgi:ADP-ribose pyrophosphatase